MVRLTKEGDWFPWLIPNEYASCCHPCVAEMFRNALSRKFSREDRPWKELAADYKGLIGGGEGCLMGPKGGTRYISELNMFKTS